MFLNTKDKECYVGSKSSLYVDTVLPGKNDRNFVWEYHQDRYRKIMQTILSLISYMPKDFDDLQKVLREAENDLELLIEYAEANGRWNVIFNMEEDGAERKVSM